MGRRGFVAALGGAVIWSVECRAQQPERMRRIGVLMLWREIDPFSQKSRTAFEQALGRSGWVEGKNIRIDYRFPAGDPALFKTYAQNWSGCPRTYF